MPGARALALLDGGDGGAPAAADLAQLVELGVHAVADRRRRRAAMAGGSSTSVRSIVGGDVERRVEVLQLAAHERAPRTRPGRPRPRAARAASGASATRSRGPAVPRVTRPRMRSRSCTLAERLAQPAALDGAEGQLLDRVQPVLDALDARRAGRRIHSRSAPRAHGGARSGRGRRAACRARLPSARFSTSSRLRRVSRVDDQAVGRRRGCAGRSRGRGRASGCRARSAGRRPRRRWPRAASRSRRPRGS